MKNKVEVNIPNLSIKNTISINEEEKKLLSLIVAFIDGRDVNDEFIISFTTLNECLNCNNDEMIKVLKSVSRKVLEVSISGSEEEYIVNIFSKISYSIKDREVKFKINNSIPMLSQKIIAFYKNIAGFKEFNLKGKYSWKIYEILKGLEENKNYYTSIEYLKNILGIKDTYKLYADFKRKVFVYTQGEINEKTDISFTFEEVKEEKKIVGFNIVVRKKRT